MSDESPIVSHVANQAYRDHIDEMTCEYPGCRRLKVGDGSEFCQDHKWLKEAGDRKRAENAMLAAWLPIEPIPYWLRVSTP